MKLNAQARINALELLTYCLSTKNIPFSVDIGFISSETDSLIALYSSAPESSYLAQHEFYHDIFLGLSHYYSEQIKHKTWKERIKILFGYSSQEESYLLKQISKVKENSLNAKAYHDWPYFPSLTHRLLYFFGFDYRRLILNQSSITYDQFDSDRKLKYLSHHLMGSTNLNKHDILQGKVREFAFSEFVQDLNDFKKHTPNLSDESMIDLVINQLSEAKNLCHDYSTIINIKLRYEEFGTEHKACYLNDVSYKIYHALFKLKPNESMLIPHGYYYHATIIFANKLESGNYQFQFFNTGGGLLGTQSYKAILISIFNFWSSSPVKISSPMSFDEIQKSELIERFIAPVIKIASTDNDMNQVLIDLYKNGRLHDDAKWLTVQTNGTCTQSSLIEWFKTRVSKETFVLFNHFMIKKSLVLLEEFKQRFMDPEKLSAVSALEKAGQRSLQDSRKNLITTLEHTEKNIKTLSADLSQFSDNETQASTSSLPSVFFIWPRSRNSADSHANKERLAEQINLLKQLKKNITAVDEETFSVKKPHHA